MAHVPVRLSLGANSDIPALLMICTVTRNRLRHTRICKGSYAGILFIGREAASLRLDDRAIAKQEIIDLLQPILMEETGLWIADYVRPRFKANLPG